MHRSLPAAATLDCQPRSAVCEVVTREAGVELSCGRRLPLRICTPRGATERKLPTILFSPGLGAEHEHYDYLCRAWTERGYITVNVTHPGTNSELWRGASRPWPAMHNALNDPEHWRQRPIDLRRVLDWMEQDAELAECIDTERLAAAGHSFGAFSTLALVGLRFRTPDGRTHGEIDERVRCVAAMSSQPKGMFGLFDDSWREIDVPVLHLTGTHDRDFQAKLTKERIVAYQETPGRDQYLVVFKRANHFAFSDGVGIGLRPPPRDPRHHAWIIAATTAFFDAHLCRSVAAAHWLRDGGLVDLCDHECTFESKHLTDLNA